ncbi:MAG TPA: NAD-dependent epimerase/dehydratase family protein [Streptomyces sp.]|nr:NAD-dependent epimerase/dehydratase family protein [Streptomyces sp.]
MARYAITGATGFVGGALARRLVAAGHEVRALVRRPDAATSLTALGVRLVPGDVAEGTGLDTLTHGVDGLFHVAGWYRVGQRDGRATGERVNVRGTQQVLEAAQRAGVRRTVYTSTLAVNSDTRGRAVDESYRFSGRHLSNYDETKARAHAVAARVAADGQPVVTVMPGLVYGPGDTSQTGDLLKEVVRGRRPLVPAGGTYCWAHVDDVAEGHVLAMERGQVGREYMLAGPPATLADGLRLAADLAGKRGPVVIPTSAVRVAAALADVVGRVVPLPDTYQAETLRSSIATYLGRADRAQRELGWHARPLDVGLTETVAALR